MKDGRAVGHGLLDGKDWRQDLVVHIYEREGFLGFVRADGCYRGDGVALVEGLVGGQHVAPEVSDGDALATDLVLPAGGHVGVSHDREDARSGLRLARVDRLYACVGMRASQHLGVQ